MCGIAAIIGENRRYNYKKIIRDMTDVIYHRGPDCEGHVSLCDNRILLGHRRLSILDLSSLGKQPMSYLDRYWITYNGEIYNYMELKKELKEKGYIFNTNTDTEMIMAAYDCWGSDCLYKFNGMWSFILVDLQKQNVFIARDRFGIKPLYYWKNTEGVWVFASEIKQFTVFPDWTAKINGQRVYDYLRWGQSDHTDETMFKGVNQIAAGKFVEFRLDDISSIGTLPIRTWYELSQHILEYERTDEVSKFYDLFTNAVALRLRSDVKVGSCLSGGLDSSSIVCTINDLLKEKGEAEKQCVVSAKAHIKKYDESEFIDEVLESRKIKGYGTYPEFDKLFDSLDEIIWIQDEPFGSTSIFAQWNVFSTASKHGLKVMLDGQGADEQLAGYHSFFAVYFTSLMKSGRYLKLLQEMQAVKSIHGYDMLFALKGILSEIMPEAFCNIYRTYRTKNEVSPRWINMEKLGARPVNPFVSAGAKTDSIRNLSVSQMTASNLQKLLHWEDRDSMAHSVESRLPFLDYRLVEYVLGLPDEYKISQGMTKRILRESMNGVLPEKVRCRMDKMGFVTPEEHWMRSNPDIFLQELKKAIVLSKGILTDSCVDRFREIIEKKRSFDSTIWRMICLGRWVEKFNVV